MLEDLAKAILKAAKMREDSYNKRKRKYTTSLLDCCNTATKSVNGNLKDAKIVYTLLALGWNDAIDWAEQY